MSLDLESLRIFVRVAEVRSFTRAAAQLSMPKARVSHQVRKLEATLGSRLFQRTTRTVHITPDGEQLLGRARALIDELDEIETLFAGTTNLRGRVRVDMPVSVARNIVIPRLRELHGAHPQLEVQLSTTDRLVDIVREGFDCVLRVGQLPDSGLVATRIGELEMVNCASPSYLQAYGKPRTVEDLEHHLLVHYASSTGASAAEFEWEENGRTRVRRLRCFVTVNSTDAFEAACVAGLGIAQTPRHGVARWLESGQLVEVLPHARCAPLPISLLHAQGRRVPRRVRVVMDWLIAILTPHFSTRPRRRRPE